MDAPKLSRIAPLIMFLWFISGVVTYAQAATLSPFIPVDGVLNPNETQRWTFTARDGEVLSFLAKSPLESSLDPVISIENANGEVLRTNDDYDYPNRLDALIEPFTAPQTGTYQLVITGRNNSAGAYQLTLFYGYANVLLEDSFANENRLTLTNPSEEFPPTFLFENGIAQLRQEGIQQTALLLHQLADYSHFYASLRVKGIAHRNGWQLGFVIRHSGTAYYAVQLNNRGLWRFVLVQDGKETTLRDWGTHPAIIAEKASFRLDVLANGGAFDVFYEGQFVATVSDNALSTGKIGVTITTANALNSTLIADFDSLTVTVPLIFSPEQRLTQNFTSGSANYVMRQLQRQGIVPAIGQIALELSESSANYAQGGVSRVPLARGTTFTHFVYGTTVSWQSGSNGTFGCGIIAQDTAEGYLLAYIENSGGAGIAYRKENSFVQNTYAQNITPKTRYALVLVVYETTATLFIEGQKIATLPIESQSGGIGNAVVNFDSGTTTCAFRDSWVWRIE